MGRRTFTKEFKPEVNGSQKDLAGAPVNHRPAIAGLAVADVVESVLL
jgi:hypothetical protein